MKKIKVHTLCKVDEQTFVYQLHTHSKRKKKQLYVHGRESCYYYHSFPHMVKNEVHDFKPLVKNQVIMDRETNICDPTSYPW